MHPIEQFLAINHTTITEIEANTYLKKGTLNKLIKKTSVLLILVFVFSAKLPTD